MDTPAHEMLKQAGGSLQIEAEDEPKTLEVRSGDEVRTYTLATASLTDLEKAARSMDGFRPSGKTSEEFLRVLVSFMPQDEAQRFVQTESVSTVIRTLRGLASRTTNSMVAASGDGGLNA